MAARKGGRPGLTAVEPVGPTFRVAQDAELVRQEIATASGVTRKPRSDKGRPRRNGKVSETTVNAGIWATVQLVPGGTDPRCRTIISATEVVVTSRVPGSPPARKVGTNDYGTIRRYKNGREIPV